MTSLEWLQGGWRQSKYATTKQSAGGLGIDQDGVWGFQCKDFWNACSLDCGSSVINGNAIVLASELPPEWSYVPVPQPGDWAVRHYVSQGVDYGDVVGVTAVSGSTITIFGQNQTNPSLTVGHVPTFATYNVSQFFKYIRLNNNEGDLDMSQADDLWTSLNKTNMQADSDRTNYNNLVDGLNKRIDALTVVVNDLASKLGTDTQHIADAFAAVNNTDKRVDVIENKEK